MGFLDRARDLLRRHREPVLEIDSDDLAVVVGAFDPAVADSTVLADAPDWRPDDPAVLRHHLTLPADRVEQARQTLAQDEWELRRRTPDGPVTSLYALRVQKLDALSCARERSRMAGLAQRLGGEAEGWDALQPPAG